MYIIIVIFLSNKRASFELEIIIYWQNYMLNLLLSQWLCVFVGFVLLSFRFSWAYKYFEIKGDWKPVFYFRVISSHLYVFIEFVLSCFRFNYIWKWQVTGMIDLFSKFLGNIMTIVIYLTTHELVNHRDDKFVWVKRLS